MSTTAGVGSTDYVAVNGTSIVALILGFASFLTMFGPAMLFIPVVGVIVAVFAWRQIGESNGTQTGRLLAAGGFVLSLVIGGFVGGKEISTAARERADRAQIEQLIVQLGEDIRAGRASEAYDKVGEKFKADVPRETFIAVMTSARQNERFGTLQGMTSLYDPSKAGLVEFQDNPTNGERSAVAAGLMKFDKLSEPYRHTMNFRKVGDTWQLEAMPDLFPKAPPAGAGGPPGGAGGPPGGMMGQPGGMQGPPAP